MKRWAVPGIPFALSLCLSLATAGPHPYWQDSGLYLTALKEWGLLYPPGFVVYESLCRVWTLLFFFLDFTLAVHLFSSFCAASACGAMALATRDLLKCRGKQFQVLREDPGDRADASGILAGVLMASGFTLWATAIYSKGYAFYTLILALLIWRMIRADESGKARDFRFVAVLIGLAWQAHPSAVLLGPVLIAFVACHAKALGPKGVGVNVGVAALAALAPSLVILPLLVSREPWLMFGRPTDAASWIRYILGGHFTSVQGAFGYDAGRAASFVRFLWEDLLGLGLLLGTFGLIALFRANRRLFWGVLLWGVPYSMVTVLFKTEGQHDCWFVAARLPIYLAIGLGAFELTRTAPSRTRPALTAMALAGTLWAVSVNYADLNQRHYVLAEDYGRVLMETAEPGAIVLLSGDDSNGLAAYLQRVKGERPDLILVTSSFLDSAQTTGSDWYDDLLWRRNPSLRRADYAVLRARFPMLELKQIAVAAFINANAGGPHPILTEVAPRPDLLRPDLQLVPAGVYWKVIPAAAEARIEERYWKFPIEPEQIRPLYRRARGQDLDFTADGVKVKPQAYERRLAMLILRARQRLAMAFFQRQRFLEAARLCQSIVDYGDEEFERNPDLIHLLAISYFGAGQMDRAEPALKVSAQISVRKENQASALFYLGEISRRRGDLEGCRRYREAARSVPDLDPEVLRALEGQRDHR